MADKRPRRLLGGRTGLRAAPSLADRVFRAQLTRAGLPQPVAEFRFHETRKWRFDYAYPIALTEWDDTREFTFGVSTAF